MKNLKLILSICLLAVTTTASAQFANGSKKSSSSPTASTESYSRLYMSYNPQTVKYDYKGAEDLTLHGITFGYTRGLSLSQKLPFFLEIGARFTYGFKKETEKDGDYYDEEEYYYSKKYSGYAYDYDYDDFDSDDDDIEIETKYKYMSIAVPVSLSYKIQIPNSEVSISPFIGITLKYNIAAKSKTKKKFGDDEYGDYEDYWDYEDYDNKENETDYFDKKDVGNNTWKRFQAGWQIGAGVNYKALYLGIHYGGDFGEICKKTTTSNWGISLGYNF